MSVHKSYFNRNNTIIYNSYVNTGRNPVTQLYFGPTLDSFTNSSYSRFIFNLDLTDLIEKYANGTISTDCNGQITHTLKMTNTSSFDNELLNTKDSEGVKRATSFDLILFRIPLTYDENNNIVNWDEGVGYDYYPTNKTSNTPVGMLTPSEEINDKAFSERPSNWYNLTTTTSWVTPGIYNNTNSATGSGINYSAITIVDTQHFEFGNEDIEFDMTNEINSILSGGTTGNTGWIIAFSPELENLTGLTQNYSVAFFTKETQTFYEPFLETTYNDLVQDDRNNFSERKTNKLYLYTYIDGEFVNLDTEPIFRLLDASINLFDFGNGQTQITSCLKTKGVYEVTIPPLTGSTPCTCYDVWTGLIYNGVSLSDEYNTVIMKPYSNSIQIGIKSKEPSLYGFDFYGIKQDEKILNTDIRKVGVVIKKAYSTQEILTDISAFYRIYVREGTTEVQVQDWEPINRTPNEYYFIFDTTDKIPNEYFIDIKVYSSGQVDTYKRTLQFQIVNKK